MKTGSDGFSEEIFDDEIGNKSMQLDCLSKELASQNMWERCEIKVKEIIGDDFDLLA